MSNNFTLQMTNFNFPGTKSNNSPLMSKNFKYKSKMKIKNTVQN